MTLSLRVGGVASKPTDISPIPAGQRFASSDCDTTKITYEFFNELIENFTLAQVAYAVTNVPNDPNALKKLLDSVRTGGYNFSIGSLSLSDSITILGSKAIQSTGDINLIIDSDNNDSGALDIYKGSIAVANKILEVANNGRTSINSSVGGDILSIIDTGAATATLANPIISFDYSNGAENSKTRAGYIGLGSTSNADFYILSDIGNIRLSGTNVSLNSTSLNLTNIPIDIGTGSYKIGDSGLYYENAGDISLKQSYDDNKSLNIESVGSILFNIDTNNNNTGKIFQWNHNGFGAGGSTLMTLNDVGELYLTNKLITNNSDIDIGNGEIKSNNNIIFQLDADNNNTNSRIGVKNGAGTENFVVYESGLIEGGEIRGISNTYLTNVKTSSINFGNENLSLYRENITFTATFYNGSTLITGSSGTSNVNSYDARFSRIGNIVTVTISNIVWSVGGNAGTTLGSYPALSTAGEFSIRGLPYNALKDSCGSIIGFYNGSGDVNVGTAYIIAGTNNIRFSTMGFANTFGIRGVTITYMV